MFATRRSSLLLDKLPHLKIAFLCCLFVIGHVSSLNLDRQRRQFQQQNDKKLELSDLMLPEAESEVLQNDMELVPAVDNNSDIYLLVPASAANQDQNLQTLTDLKETYIPGNIESNSDMLMQESDDASNMQILELPEGEIKTEIREDLVANNELEQFYADKENEKQSLNDADQISNSIISSLAETDQKTENKSADIEGYNKLDHLPTSSINMANEDKIFENYSSGAQKHKNSEQNMMGLVMEQYNEAPINSLQSESLPEIKKSEEDVHLEDSEIQPSIDELSQQLQENASEIQEAESDENFQGMELAQTTPQQDESLAEIKHEVSETDELNEEPHILKEHVNLSNEVLEASTEDEDQTIDSIMKVPANDQEEIQTEKPLQLLEETDAAENSQPFDKTSSYEEYHVDDEIKAVTQETSMFDNENQANFEVTSVETPQAESGYEIQSIDEEAEEIQFNEAQPEKEQSLSMESQSSNLSFEIEAAPEHFKPTERNEIFESSTYLDIEQPYLSSESEIAEEITKTDDEEKIRDEVTTEFESYGEDELQSSYEPQVSEEDQDNKYIQPMEEIEKFVDAQKVEHEPVEDEGIESHHMQHAEVLQSEEEPVKEMQSSGGYENVEEAGIDESHQNSEQTQMEEMQNSETDEKEAADNIKSTEESKSDELTDVVENTQNVEENKFVEESQTIPADRDPDADDENETLTENPNEVDLLSNSAEIKVEEMPAASGVEMESSFEESTAVDKQDSELHQTNPIDNSASVSTDEESNKPGDGDDLIEVQPILLATENFLHTVAPIEINTNEEVQYIIPEIQEPIRENNSYNYLHKETIDSEIIKEMTTMLTTIVQVPSSEELTQQQHYQEYYTQPTATEAVSSATSKPLNVLDGVLNYVNASFTNQMGYDDDTNEDMKQDVKVEEQQGFTSELRRYDGAQVWRIVVQNDKERKLADELQTKFDGQLWKEVKQEVDYLLKPQVLADALKYVTAANLSRIVLIDNLQKVIDVENPPAEEIAQLQNRKGYRLTWKAYHRLDDIHGYLDYLAKTYPDICSVEIIGHSILNRPLKILKISNGNSNNTAMWIDGGTHAREWISPAVVTYIANQIVEGWDDLPSFMRNVNWYIHPVVNPDGYEYSHTTDRLWRKNMRSHGRACPGVDLNRNFGYMWGGRGTSDNPCSAVYRGSKAFSELETFYVSKFISNFPRNTFKGYLSFHSYGQYILYPWGYDYLVTNDMADLDLVARQAATIITKSTGSKYTVGASANTLYRAAGGSDDWAKGFVGIKYAYTIEMGDTGRYGFVLPADFIEPNGENGFSIVKTVAKAITVGKNGRRRRVKTYKNE